MRVLKATCGVVGSDTLEGIVSIIAHQLRKHDEWEGGERENKATRR